VVTIVALVCVLFLLHVRSALVAIITLPLGVLLGRMSAKQAAIAIANKTARIAWAIMVHGGNYEAGHRAIQYRAEARVAAE
jgi:Cu/Ag efflux pump CusA